MCYSEASERCQAEKRKTINGEDILFAMSTLGFDNYVEPLKLYLQKYREAMKGERQIESELTGMGGDVMTAQQLQVRHPNRIVKNIHLLSLHCHFHSFAGSPNDRGRRSPDLQQRSADSVLISHIIPNVPNINHHICTCTRLV